MASQEPWPRQFATRKQRYPVPHESAEPISISFIPASVLMITRPSSLSTRRSTGLPLFPTGVVARCRLPARDVPV